jgi:hypothetical protein
MWVVGVEGYGTTDTKAGLVEKDRTYADDQEWLICHMPRNRKEDHYKRAIVELSVNVTLCSTPCASLREQIQARRSKTEAPNHSLN